MMIKPYTSLLTGLIYGLLSTSAVAATVSDAAVINVSGTITSANCPVTVAVESDLGEITLGALTEDTTPTVIIPVSFLCDFRAKNIRLQFDGEEGNSTSDAIMRTNLKGVGLRITRFGAISNLNFGQPYSWTPNVASPSLGRNGNVQTRVVRIPEDGGVDVGTISTNLNITLVYL